MATQSVNGPIQSVNVTIFDDNIVEDFEFVNLRLTTENPDIVFVDQNVARIEIADNDGMIHYMLLISMYLCVYLYLPFSCHC